MTTHVWIDGTRTNITKLEASYGEHGDEQLTFQLPIRMPPKWRKKVFLEDEVYGFYWGGYFAVWNPDWRAGCGNVICRGMYKTAEDAKFYETKIFRAGTPAKNMITEAISRCANISDFDAVDDFTFQLVEDSPSFGLQDASQVFNYGQQLTGYLSTPIQWEVRTDKLHPFNRVCGLYTYATDYAPRYRVRINKNRDTFTPSYDCDVTYNVGLLKWGTEQYQAATNSGYSAPQLPQNPFIALAIPDVDYSVIPDIRMKVMDVQGTINNITEVQQLAAYLVTRNNVVRPVSTTLEIDSATIIQSVYPAIISDNLPHELVRSNYAIEILNDLSEWGMYGVSTFYITAAKYNYDTCKLVLTLGDPILQDTFRLLGSYDVSREYIGAQASLINLVHRDADVLVQYGTEFPGRTGVEAANPDDATMLNNFSAGHVVGISTIDASTSTPKFDDPNSQFYQPTGQSVDPRVIADYGTQANFGREASSIGIKGFIKVIPMKVVNWSIDFTPPPNSVIIPTDSITIKFYQVYPFVVGVDTPFATKSVTAAQGALGDFSGLELVNFPQGGKIGIEVSIAAATTNCGFQIGIGGRKIYPALGIT